MRHRHAATSLTLRSSTQCFGSRRRAVVALAAFITLPGTANAQQKKTWRIGFLGDGAPAARAPDLNALRAGLADLGYREGQNIILEVRWTEGIAERRALFAHEFVKTKVDVIVTHGVSAAREAKAATTSIPIVVAVAADYLNTGLVSSLARPGGNLTGLSDLVGDLSTKEIDLVKEVLPHAQAVGVLFEANHAFAKHAEADMRAAAQRIGLRAHAIEITTIDDVTAAFASLAKADIRAVVVVHTPFTVGNRKLISELALRNRIAMFGAPAQFSEAGALMSYGPDLTKYFRRAASLVDKIFKGRKPADIPIEQGTTFELVINAGTARALGIRIPQSVLVRADRVIE